MKALKPVSYARSNSGIVRHSGAKRQLMRWTLSGGAPLGEQYVYRCGAYHVHASGLRPSRSPLRR
jgi:hypothetical protein